MRYEVWLNGVGLSTLSDKIYIIDVQESTPKLEFNLIPNAAYEGQRMLSRQRKSLTVTVVLAVRERNSERRAQIINDLMDWLKDGTLMVSYRPNQQLSVKYTDLPGVGSALQWADNMSIEFTAYDSPYWQAAMQTRVSLQCVADVAQTTYITPDGTAQDCRMEFYVRAEAALDEVTLVGNGYTLAFAGLSMVPGDVLRGYYDTDGYQHFEVNGASVYSLRSGNDDIWLRCRRANAVTVAANGAATIILSARGRYL